MSGTLNNNNKKKNLNILVILIEESKFKKHVEPEFSNNHGRMKK